MQISMHTNPVKQKVHFPLLKSSLTNSITNSYMNGQYDQHYGVSHHYHDHQNIGRYGCNNVEMINSARGEFVGKQPVSIAVHSVKCAFPQILKIRSCKSTANIMSSQLSAAQKPGNQSSQTSMLPKKTHKKPFSDQNKAPQTGPIKQPHQTLHISPSNLTIRYQNQSNQSLDKLLQQNTQLNNQLSKKQMYLMELQKEVGGIEEMYIRLLEVSNQCSQSQVRILLREDEGRDRAVGKQNGNNISQNTIRSGRSRSRRSEQAQKLKAKLDKIDISTIKQNKACTIENNGNQFINKPGSASMYKTKESSFKLSEVMSM